MNLSRSDYETIWGKKTQLRGREGMEGRGEGVWGEGER